MSKRRTSRINWGVVVLKSFLCLLVVVGFVDIIYRGYILFTHQINPVIGTILFLVEVGLWIWIVVVLRMPKYQHSKPSFWLVFGAVLGVILICAFAGIQPLATYKDNIIQNATSIIKTTANETSLPNIPVSSTPIAPVATVGNIYVGFVGLDRLCVELKPTQNAKADYLYKVDLYEKGILRNTSTITWNQPEINVQYKKIVTFPVTSQEAEAYRWHKLDDIFSADVHE